MDPTDRYMWIGFIGVTCLNAAVWWHRGEREAAERPELREGYVRLVRGLLVFGNLPWLVMGAAIMVGGADGMDSFMTPPSSPFVIAFHLTVIFLWVALARWVFWGGGADELASHPGLLNLRGASPRSIKWLVAACLFSGVVAMLGMVTGRGPGAP